jgi:predicted Fe-S protein YdhL (DUF1289 family)
MKPKEKRAHIWIFFFLKMNWIVMKHTEREHISGIFLTKNELDKNETYRKRAHIWIFFFLQINWEKMNPTEREHIS